MAATAPLRRPVGPDPEPPGADRPDSVPLRRRLVLPALAAAAFQAIVVLGDKAPAVDMLAYLEAGRNLLGGEGYVRFGRPELHFPPLVPMAVSLLEKLTGAEMAALRIWQLITGLVVGAAIAALAHRLWRDDSVTVVAAWLGGTLSGLAPLFVRRGAGSEAVTVALLLVAVLLILGPADRLGRPPAGRDRWLFGAGVAVGLAYLARPEALMPGALLGLAVVVRALAGGGRGAPVRAVRAGAALAIGAGLLIAPYVAYLHGHTGSWSPTAKSQDVSIEAWRAVADDDRAERDQILYALTEDGDRLNSETRPLTELAADHPGTWARIVAVNARTILSIYVLPLWPNVVAWVAMPFPLVVAAGWSVWRERRRSATVLVVALGLVPVATCLAFFTLPRYLALTTAVLAVYAARGLVDWRRRLSPGRGRALVVAAGLLVAASTVTEAMSFLPGSHTLDPVDQVAVGRWLSENTAPGSRVMTRSFHVQFYADRPIVAMPASDYPSMMAFAHRMGVQYVVADENLLRARRPLLYVPLTSLSPPGLRLIAVLGGHARVVRIYVLDPLPPASTREPIPLGYVGD